MNIRYDRAGDILIIELGPLSESPGAINPAPGVYVDITEQGKVLAIEVLGASEKYPAEVLAGLVARYDAPMLLVEAAAIAKTTSTSLLKAIQRGRLRAEKRGRDWYVTDAEIDAYLVSRKHSGPGSRDREAGPPTMSSVALPFKAPTTTSGEAEAQEAKIQSRDAGRATNEARARASRENGTRGGRPKKVMDA